MTKMSQLSINDTVDHAASKASTITIKEIAATVAATFRSVYDEFRVDVPEDLTESIPQTPLMQVYPDMGGGDTGGNNDRASFGAGIRRDDIVIHCDVYARQRSDIGTDLSVCLDILEECINKLEAQSVKPYFGRNELKGFKWRWERNIFEYNKVLYVGFKIILTFQIF